MLAGQLHAYAVRQNFSAYFAGAHVTGGVTVPDLYARTLGRAADIVGGEGELAARLNVLPGHLHLWMLGAHKPPLDIFLKAVDIVVEHSPNGDGAA
jgi:hypothetical protein